jgi:hypothetical protein
MGNLKTNIIVIGLGNSGSSAVQELLMEYKNVGKFRYEEPGWSTGEMNHFRLPGMIGDQLAESTDKLYPDNLSASLKEVKRPKVPFALLFRKYIPDSVYSLYKTNEFTRGFASERIKEFRDQQAYYDSLTKISNAFHKTRDYNERFEAAKNWLSEVNEIFGEDKDFVVHKPIVHECHLEIWPRLFEPFKLMLIIREPFDQMSSVLGTSMMFRDMPWKYQMLFGMDKGNRRPFHTLIDTTLMRMNYIDKIIEKVGNDRFLMLDFEGLVNNYDLYVSIIERFIGLSPENHVMKYRFFNPEESVLTIKKFIHLIDPSDIDKLELMKIWYERNMKIIKEKYL